MLSQLLALLVRQELDIEALRNALDVEEHARQDEKEEAAATAAQLRAEVSNLKVRAARRFAGVQPCSGALPGRLVRLP